MRRDSSIVSVCILPCPVSVALNRVTGHLATCAGIVTNHLGYHARGELCDILGGSPLTHQTLCTRKCMHCGTDLSGMSHTHPLVFVWHPRRIRATTNRVFQDARPQCQLLNFWGVRTTYNGAPLPRIPVVSKLGS